MHFVTRHALQHSLLRLSPTVEYSNRSPWRLTYRTFPDLPAWVYSLGSVLATTVPCSASLEFVAGAETVLDRIRALPAREMLSPTYQYCESRPTIALLQICKARFLSHCPGQPDFVAHRANHPKPCCAPLMLQGEAPCAHVRQRK